MAPRTEFVLLSAALALLLSVLAFALTGPQASVGQWSASVLASLKVAPAAALAAALGAWLASAWHRRAAARQRRWAPGGLTLRTLLLSYLLFLPVMALWMLATVLGDQWWAADPGSLRENLAWIPPAALIFTALAIVLGAVPAFVIEYFVCRRYLRRQAVVTTGSA